MVQGLLTLARLDQEQVIRERTSVDIAALLRQEVAQVRPAAREKGLNISLDLSTNAVVVGHENMLREVIFNVLDNALKYTNAGTIDIHLQRIGSGVYLTVSDTGIGISAHDIPRITDQFYRAASSGLQRTEGSGLGLSLVQRIVDLHDGQLAIDSVPHEGTTVYITLPDASR